MIFFSLCFLDGHEGGVLSVSVCDDGGKVSLVKAASTQKQKERNPKIRGGRGLRRSTLVGRVFDRHGVIPSEEHINMGVFSNFGQ